MDVVLKANPQKVFLAVLLTAGVSTLLLVREQQQQLGSLEERESLDFGRPSIGRDIDDIHSVEVSEIALREMQKKVLRKAEKEILERLEIERNKPTKPPSGAKLLDMLRDNYQNFNVSYKKGGFLVETPGCKITDVDPFDPTIKRFIVHADIQCKGPPPLVTFEKNWLNINHSLVYEYYGGDLDTCLYQEVFRTPCDSGNDDSYDISPKSVKFDKSIKFPEMVEFIRVTCISSTSLKLFEDFFANVAVMNNIEERCKKNHENTRNLVKERLNVIIMGIDGVSRLNFIRQMQRSYRYLKQELGAIELKGYNKVADNTLVNVMPMLAGKYLEEVNFMQDVQKPLDTVPFIWKKFSQSGYRTMMCEDAPYMAIFNYLRGGFKKKPVDYYLRPLSMAIDMSDLSNKSTFHCVGKRLEIEIALDYVYRLAETFRKDPYFAFGWNARISHDSLNLPRVADKPYANFLRKLKENGHLENTVLFLMSDHGLRYGQFLKTYIGKLEERLPAVFLVFPPWFFDKYPKIAQNLQQNELKLTTPFDLYETLTDILWFTGEPRPIKMTRTTKNKKVYQRGISLFSDIPLKRTCEDAQIQPHWCTCQNHKPVARDDEQVVNAAYFLVFKLNEYLNPVKGQCAKLELERITDALIGEENEQALTAHVVRSEVDDHIEKIQYDKIPHYKTVHYLLTVQTMPGKGVFEATVKVSKGINKYEVMGDVSRISMYGDTSNCITEYTLRKFCYCRHLLSHKRQDHER